MYESDLCRVSRQEDIGRVVDSPEPEETLVRVARKISNTGHVTVEVFTAVPAAEEVPDVVDHRVGHRAHRAVVAPGQILHEEEQT